MTNTNPRTHRATKKDQPTALSLLTENRLRPTSARISVLKLFQSGGPYTPHDVYRVLTDSPEEICLATTYRVLGDLVESGILARQRFESGPSSYYLQTRSEDTEILCSDCNGVLHISGSKLQVALEAVAKESGVTLEKFKVHIQGLCKKCARKNKIATH